MKQKKDIYLLKLGEIWLKGNNKNFFEKMLRQRIKSSLHAYDPKIISQQGRFFLRLTSGNEIDIEHKLSRIFGLVGFSKAETAEKEMNDIIPAAAEVFKKAKQKRDIQTFKVETRRADKSFPLNSYEISSKLGSEILRSCKDVKVDVKNPDFVLSVEIRDCAYIYGDTAKSPGGLPTGCAGKGMLLLSGGIDSPAAGYLMAKRGLYLNSIYFHAYPYTSHEALKKVEDLAQILADYQGNMKLFVIPFTDIQLYLKKYAKPNELTLHMRYAMVRIANILTRQEHGKCLVTGESLSQVASQTLESISYTDSASEIPIFRPLIGLDKEEIISISEKIGTFKTSILPYDDCCTIFSPKHPLVKPEMGRITSAFKKLELEAAIEQAAQAYELKYFQ
ncbi:MAG: tRNA 4-thiouridine(8) synthase ThiI [Spirochaetia bacterium]|nr:tRNA 4-thiouridine(8) synthase ThiI [Spirochaetia bacterium]